MAPLGNGSLIMIYWLVGLLGLVLGSFFNVCIYRLPREESIVWPGSHCPRCGHGLSPWENIPLVSFLLLKGSCRYCRQPIAYRYPLIELLTAFLMVALVWRFGISWLFFQGAVLAGALVVVTFIDWEHQIIPDVISLPGLAVGLGLSWLTGNPGWKSSLIGVLVGGGLLYLLASGYELLTKREGMGGGDIKLLAMIGAFLGWTGVLVTVILASLIGSLLGIALILVWKKGRTQALPFGPFLALGALIHLFRGPEFITWYLNFSSLSPPR
jgi:leader peptidase (prepilin peptidase)/N-methyltransferase